MILEGGCLCGAVRYRTEAEPAMQVICHCKTCQKNSGSAYSLNVAVPLDSLEVSGDTPKTYEDRSGASGKAFNRHFCGACGSHVYSDGEAYGALAFIKAGTLDDAGPRQSRLTRPPDLTPGPARSVVDGERAPVDALSRFPVVDGQAALASP